MKPIYRLDGIDSAVNDRLLTINVLEHDGGEADKLTVEIDNRDSRIAFPPRGAQVEVFLGWDSIGPALASLGSFTIDTVAMGWGPRIITIRGSSANFSSDTLKQSRINNYENKSLADIASEVAGRNQLGALVDPSLPSSQYTMLHQTDESDMAFMARIARENGATFKIAGGQLIIQKIGNTVNAAGGSMGITVTPDMVKPGSVLVTWNDRSKYDGAQATSYDPANAQRQTAGQPGFTVRHPMVDADRARAQADGKQAELETNEADARCELAIGNPNATASGNLTFSDFCEGIDGAYPISTVEHNYDSAGYTTKIEANNSTSSD